MIDYNDRYFVPATNSEHGEVDSDTLFHYRQEGDLLQGTYSGGRVRFGTLIARVGEDGSLDMRYQHINEAGELMTGICRSVPEILPDGRIRLHESWRWTCGSGDAGESVIEEIDPGRRAAIA